MNQEKIYDVIITGGSYAGLSAAMALGRSLRQVLIIDAGKPCNRQTPHSHNFLTQDGSSPAEIARIAREQVLNYDTVQLQQGYATRAEKKDGLFRVRTEAGDTFAARKLILATGVNDVLPDIPGFAACWGISVLHCPYCHGYEVRQESLAILGNGDAGYEYSRLLSNWSTRLSLLTNGPATLTAEQRNALHKHGVQIIEHPVTALEHEEGYLKHIVFSNGSKAPFSALFARPVSKQHNNLAEQLGCALNEQGLITADALQRSTVPGLCGYCGRYNGRGSLQQGTDRRHLLKEHKKGPDIIPGPSPSFNNKL